MAKGAVIADCFSDYVPVATVPGNGRLIAAAPQMLSALIAVFDDNQDVLEAYADVKGTDSEPGWVEDLRESHQAVCAALTAAGCRIEE